MKWSEVSIDGFVDHSTRIDSVLQICKNWSKALDSSIHPIWFVLLIVFGSCGGNPSGPEQIDFAIRIVGVVVAPATADKEYWDCCGSLSSEDWNAFQSVVSPLRPVAEILVVVARISSGVFQAPDPKGMAALNIGQGYLTQLPLEPIEGDTYRATWENNPVFVVSDLELTRISITIVDDDLDADDPIGVVTL